MVNFLQGIAKHLRIGGKVFSDIILSLNLEENYILCLIRENTLGKLLRSEFEGVLLEDVELFNGFYAEKIEDLMIIQYSAGAPKTFLNTYFGLLKTENGNPYGFISLKLIPKRGFIELNLHQDYKKEYTEILFEDFFQTIPPPVAWEKLREKFSIIPYSDTRKGIISFIGNGHINDLEAYTEGLELALSFAQGKEVLRKIIFSNGKAKIFFYQKEKNPVFFAIPSENLQEFLIKFLEYWFKLNQKERTWFKRLILNLAYAKTKNTLIENKLLNLLASYEMLKEGETLTKQDLKEKLNVTQCEGMFITTLRNKIMHGYLFEDAINIAFEKARKENDCDKAGILKKIESLKGFDKALKTYFALIFYLENFILRSISYKGLYYNPLNSFAEEIVNEILIEDKEILEELKMR